MPPAKPQESMAYQRRRTPYRSKSDSFEMKTRLCVSAWAMSIRSKGSRWGPGSAPARLASSTVMASSSKPWFAIAPATSAAIKSAPGSLPSRCLVVISQADAALINTAFASSAIVRYTVSDRRLLSVIHQRKVCVSNSARTAIHLPMLSTPPPAVGRRNCLE